MALGPPVAEDCFPAPAPPPSAPPQVPLPGPARNAFLLALHAGWVTFRPGTREGPSEKQTRRDEFSKHLPMSPAAPEAGDLPPLRKAGRDPWADKKGGARSSWSLAGSCLLTAGNSHLSQILRGAADWWGTRPLPWDSPVKTAPPLSSQGRGASLGPGWRAPAPEGSVPASVWP